MNKIRIGIICPSEIAFRRFMPALGKGNGMEYMGVAIANEREWNGNLTKDLLINEKKKADNFCNTYGGKVYESYSTMLNCEEIDAIYLPLPPALHYKWAKKALEKGKHVFLEKPSTTCSKDTEILASLAKKKHLALHENYMFIYHSQITKIKELLEQQVIGNLRLIRTSFGFPRRSANDFRYKKELGGGSLLDCGGYPIKLIQVLLSDVKIDSASLYYENDIDLYGAVQVTGKEATAQISFGMDNSYKCELEIWGSKGTIYTGRVFTAPVGMETTICVKTADRENILKLEGDDSFEKSIQHFLDSISNETMRLIEYQELKQQIRLIEEIRERG